MHTSTMLFSSCLMTVVISIVSAQPIENAPQTSRISKRSYPWYSEQTNLLSLYNAGNAFPPAQYTIPRPYYIPVYGTSGGHRIYYPPQRIYLTSGSPPDNPMPRPFQAPSYLPPRPNTPPKENPPTVPAVDTRFDDEDDQDAPVWGMTMGHMQLSDDKEVARPIIKPTEQEFPPTRPPITNPPSPPLVHDISGPQKEGSTIRTETPTLGSSGPTNCTWAIISCCLGSNPSLAPQNCFEQRGCPGPFWGPSPCETEYAQAAIAAIQNYYKNS